jgi:disulfide oxidoreductase YuzD
VGTKEDAARKSSEDSPIPQPKPAGAGIMSKVKKTPYSVDVSASDVNTPHNKAVESEDWLSPLLHRYKYPDEYLPIIHDYGAKQLKRMQIVDEAKAAIQAHTASAVQAARVEGMQMVSDAIKGGYIPGITPPEAITTEFVYNIVRMLIWENDGKPAATQPEASERG